MYHSFEWSGRYDGEGKEHLRLYQTVTPTLSKNGFCLIGFASDEGVKRNHGRVGAQQAPDIIRQQLANFAIHRDIKLSDIGNIFCDNGNLEQAQQRLGQQVQQCLTNDAFPIVLGGGHEVAFGSFLGSFGFSQQQQKRIGIINFDAHFDLRDAAQATSGTPFYQAAQLCDQHQQDFQYLCLGIAYQSNTQCLFNRAKQLGVQYLLDYEMNNAELVQKTIHQFLANIDFLHISFDLDVLPQSQAPGVSAPAPYGVDYKTIFNTLQYLFKSPKTILFEIAEYNPCFDKDNQTAKIAAHMIYELIHGIHSL